MRKRTVRLTESELTRLIKRIVEDTERGAMEMERPMRGREGFSIMDAVEKASKIFGREFADELDEEVMSDLEDAASKINVERVVSKLERKSNDEISNREEMATEKIEDMISSISESFLNEDVFDRVKSIMAKVGVFGGLAILGMGGLAYASMITGYVDFEFLKRVHEMVTSSGCDKYCGPLSFFIACLGIAMYFSGRGMMNSMKMDRESSRRGGSEDEEMGEGYYY